MGSDWAMHADRDNEFRRLRTEIDRLRAELATKDVRIKKTEAELIAVRVTVSGMEE